MRRSAAYFMSPPAVWLTEVMADVGRSVRPAGPPTSFPPARPAATGTLTSAATEEAAFRSTAFSILLLLARSHAKAMNATV
ncbi:hypothetical protein AHiyo8_45140 [Arthrobacter sp. Hiyo8]|nr:hypothetical protein AHiyo8_45140 [Arthrobacter sp. Hiyo8]